MITLVLITMKWSQNMSNLDDTDIFGNKLEQYISQAYDWVFTKNTQTVHIQEVPWWYQMFPLDKH